MNYFSEENGSLIFRENGETVMVTPWGTNSLRVRSVILGETRETESGAAAKRRDFRRCDSSGRGRNVGGHHKWSDRSKADCTAMG